MAATVEPIYQAPEIPNKWEVIPVHNSDRGNFKRCRRYWDWNSPARQNLTLRADVYGINTDLWFGTGIHYALEQYYTPGIRRDPVESWKTWFDIQWRGGMVGAEWLDKVYDLKPREILPNSPEYLAKFGHTQTEFDTIPLYVVRGLEDILPDPDHEKYDELFTLGINMMDFYREYAEKHDNFVVLMTEHDFSVPIWDYGSNDILKMIDMREDSPNYGNRLEVHSRGRMDAVILREGSELLGLMDHKTAASIGEDYFIKLDTDEQMTTYLYAAEVEAKYYGLPHAGKPFEEVIYNVMRKTYPKPPTELKNGMFSVDRANESTTYEMLQHFIRTRMPGVPLSEKQQGYVDYVRDSGDEQFIIRRPVRRNRHELQSAGERMYLETLDMLAPNVRIYPNKTNDWRCINCQFRAPCLASDDGGDAQQLINDNYMKAKDR